MKHTFKLIAVLLLGLLLMAGASAQVNWLKEANGTKYLAWDNGTLSKTIKNGQSATFATGYFGSNLGQVHLTVTVNKKTDGTIVSTVVSKNINASSFLGYETITINPQHYGDKTGEYIIVVKLQDANQQKVDSSLYLKVNPNWEFGLYEPGPLVNSAPVMNPISDREVFENSKLTINMSATDNGTIAHYEGQYCINLIADACIFAPLSILESDAVLTTEAGSPQKVGKFTWTPNFDFMKYPVLAKNVKVRFRAVDTLGKASNWELVNILVKNKNRAPVFNPALPDTVVIMEGQEYELEAHGFDADGDDMMIELFNEPAGAEFTDHGDGDATFTWEPGFNQAGTYVMQFRVTDPMNDFSVETVTIQVMDFNHAPVLDPIGNKTVTEEDNLSFTVTASDPDSDPLQFTAAPLPSGASFNTTTHKFSWTPNLNQAGSYQLTFKVTDVVGNQDQETITITVLNKTSDDPECDDNIDNDGDEQVDYPQDPGCDNEDDDDETDDDKPECDDGIDNDGDGKIDFPADPGCDNDDDDDETDDEDLPECKDGIDNDGDNKIDHPADPHCDNPEDDDESPQCDDGLDNDGDGKIDFPADPGCDSIKDNSERNPQCNDGKDNDNDGKIDFPADPGCDSLKDDDEHNAPLPKPQCDDGIDNDGDGKIDFPNDPGCSNQNDDDEFNAPAPEASFAQTNIKFKSALVDEIVYAGNTMAVHTNIFNNGDTDLKDLKVQASIYEIGVFGSTNDFTLSNGKGANKTVYVYIPEDVQPGWYLVKITAKNSRYHTSTYRIAYIDSNTF